MVEKIVKFYSGEFCHFPHLFNCFQFQFTKNSEQKNDFKISKFYQSVNAMEYLGIFSRMVNKQTKHIGRCMHTPLQCGEQFYYYSILYS